MEHVLKIDPIHFEAVVNNSKRFEIRKNDRDFKIKDTLILKEWTKGNGYSGISCGVSVIYILKGSDFKALSNEYCVLGIDLLYVNREI